jgi:hypothetical protein
MLYHFRGETFKLENKNDDIKLYHKAVNKWSKGWTYVGTFKTEDKAQTAAKKYTL